MRRSPFTEDPRFRSATRRRAGIAFLGLALSVLLYLDWVAAAPQPVLAPEGGGRAVGVPVVSEARPPAAQGGAAHPGVLAERARDQSNQDPRGRAAGRGAPVGKGKGTPGHPTGSSGARALKPEELELSAVEPLAEPTETNPLNLLVDGTGFIRFLGFTTISLGFAIVVLVFFWSHRRDPR